MQGGPVDIGIGISNAVPGTSGSQLLDWARRAEATGFHSLATIGAVSYPGCEELTTVPGPDQVDLLAALVY